MQCKFLSMSKGASKSSRQLVETRPVDAFDKSAIL